MIELIAQQLGSFFISDFANFDVIHARQGRPRAASRDDFINGI